MVADRQHLPNCDEGAPVVTPSSKKVRPSAPLNIYRPPALRQRNEALEVSDSDTGPDIVPVSKAERLRPAKQRRPDIQVYVPRAKRILAAPDGNSKTSVPASSTQAESRRTPSSRKSVAEKETHQTPAKIKPFSNRSSYQHSGVINVEENISGVGSDHMGNSEKLKNSCATTTCIAGRGSALYEEVDIKVNLEQKVKEERNESVTETLIRCSAPSDEINDLAEDYCRCGEVQVGNSEHSVIKECRTELPPSVSAKDVVEPVPGSNEDLGNICEDVPSFCKTCNSVLRLCDCSNVDFVSTVNESSELSTCSVNSASSENIGDLKESVTREIGTVSGERNTLDCKLDSTWIDTGTEASSSQGEQNLLVQKIPIELVEQDANSDTEQCINEDKNNSGHQSEGNVSSSILIKSCSGSDMADTDTSENAEKSECASGDSDSGSHDISEANIEESNVDAVKSHSVPANSTPITLNPEECTWEMMFDENGDCLDPKLIEEITNAVGSVKIEKPKSDYNSYQNKPEIFLDPGDEFSHVIEIYNFPAAFKTEDLVTIFSPYKNGGFEIKWVDNTHALGIFSSSLIAAEVLATDHPFVKTRPLREASHESRMKARRSAEFLQPYKVRPETCAALARRLVTGALGVKLNTSREEREAERRLLREAREKKRLAAKQRDEIWEGTFSAN